MKYLLIFLSSLTLNGAFGQGTKLDSSVGNMYLDKYVNRNFDSLLTDQGLKTLETKYGIKFQSLAACINPLTIQILNEDEIKFIKVRLEQIAQVLFNEGTPILISVGGSNSVQGTKELNEKGNRYNVTYVSFGNYALLKRENMNLKKPSMEKQKNFLELRRLSRMQPAANKGHKTLCSIVGS
jgi:hypothetical protein